jgi:DNA recombination-dependent growth factor C
MDKTIVIGIGGTGLDAIRSLRRRVVETHGSLAALPHLGFLYIDTDDKEVIVNEDNRKRWEVLGVSIALSESEYAIIDAPEIGPIVSNISAFPHIQEWFPVEVLRSIDQSAEDTPGARQIRPLGRFAFTLKVADIEEKFKSIYGRLPQAAGGGKTQTYIICSLSGGTGSGMFLDLAYRIKEWTAGNCQSLAFLIFPELTTLRGTRYLVNAYAALLELNYFNIGKVNYGAEDRNIGFKLPQRERAIQGSPFDYCYIISPRNESGVEVSLETLPEMVAHRIYLNFDSSFADDARSLLNNGSFERVLQLTDPFTGNKHSQNFFTFGLSYIQYPIEQITEIFAYRIGSDLISGWLKHREVPGNINERVQSYLPELKLTDDFLLGSKDFFGTKKDFDSYEREVEDFVNGLKRQMPDRNIAPLITERQRQYIEQFRSVGLLKFYQDKRDDLGGAVHESVRLIRQTVANILTDQELGHEFAERFIEEMIRIFTLKHQSFVETINGLPARETGSRRTLGAFFNELTQAEGKMVFRDKAIKECLNKVCDAMKLNISATIGIRAFDYGRAFLARLLEELNAIKENLVDWRNAVEKLRDELIEEISRRKSHLLEKMANVKEFNGAILFDDERASALYANFDTASAIRHVESKLLRKFDDGAMSVPFAGDGLVEEIYLAALDWLTNISQVRVTDKNVADKLFEDNPESSARRNILSENFRKSTSFLVFDQIEKHIGAGHEGVAYTYSPTTSAKIVGILDDDGGSLKRVSELKKDVEASTGLQRNSIKKISDTHQILFLQEITAFPLRLIKDLKTIKERYVEYIRNKQAIPLHIQKHFDPPLMDLFLASEDEIREFEETEENFLLAWIDGKIRIETNQREMANEIRYRFVEAGSETFAKLGLTWEAAVEFCLGESEEARKIRKRLSEDIKRYLRAFDTQPKKKELSIKLTRHLDDLKRGFELGEEDVTYQRYDRVRRRIFSRHNLPYEASPPPPRPEITEAIDKEVADRFMTLVRTALRNSKGQLSPAMSNMIRASQKRFGLDDMQAQRLIKAVEIEFQEPETSVEYREMFEAFYEDGEISDDERALLVERQVELNLSDEQVQEIEAAMIGKRKAEAAR